MRLLILLTIALTSLGQAEKPNILFIFADDMTHATIGALGHPEVKTPHLDKLFQSGTTFTHVYNSGAWNGAVCQASRNMLMTGRHLWHAHREESQTKKSKLWPHLMAEAGYRTYMTGKWHVQANVRKAFHHIGHIRPGMPSDIPAGYNRPIEGQEDSWDPTNLENEGFWKGGTHWSEVEADTAVQFLKNAKEDPKPFFFYLAFNAPHDPRQSPQEYLDLYPPEKLSLPKNFLPSYPHRDSMRSDHKVRDEYLAPMPRTPYSVKVNRREYFALITHLDAQIGRVLNALDQNGQRENTLIIFTSDHGLSVGRHGLIGKQNPYDHSIRVPFVVSGPGIKAGKKITKPIYLQDIMPSTLEWAHAKIPARVQYQSILPLLKNQTEGRDQIYFGYRDSQRALIKDGYKLIIYPRTKVARLYNMKEDPLERNDLLGKEHPQIELAQSLYAHLQIEALKHGDQLAYPKIW